MAYFPSSCDYVCKDCSQNKCGWCAFRDRPIMGELVATTYHQSATIISDTKEEE